VREDMRSTIEKALENMRAQVQEGGPTQPHGLLLLQSGLKVITYDGELMCDWRSKNLISATLLHEMYEKKARCFVFASEMFAGQLPPGVSFNEMPINLRDWPREYLREYIAAHANALGEKGVVVTQPFTRDEFGEPTFGEIDWDTPMDSRFTFDLSAPGVTMDAAIADAMGRGRLGKEESKWTQR
jgi:hypothetical protein